MSFLRDNCPLGCRRQPQCFDKECTDPLFRHMSRRVNMVLLHQHNENRCCTFPCHCRNCRHHNLNHWCIPHQRYRSTQKLVFEHCLIDEHCHSEDFLLLLNCTGIRGWRNVGHENNHRRRCRRIGQSRNCTPRLNGTRRWDHGSHNSMKKLRRHSLFPCHEGNPVGIAIEQ